MGARLCSPNVPSSCILVLLRPESFVKHSRDSHPLKLSPHLPCEAVPSFPPARGLGQKHPSSAQVLVEGDCTAPAPAPAPGKVPVLMLPALSDLPPPPSRSTPPQSFFLTSRVSPAPAIWKFSPGPADGWPQRPPPQVRPAPPAGSRAAQRLGTQAGARQP